MTALGCRTEDQLPDALRAKMTATPQIDMLNYKEAGSSEYRLWDFYILEWGYHRLLLVTMSSISRKPHSRGFQFHTTEGCHLPTLQPRAIRVRLICDYLPLNKVAWISASPPLFFIFYACDIVLIWENTAAFSKGFEFCIRNSILWHFSARLIWGKSQIFHL